MNIINLSDLSGKEKSMEDKILKAFKKVGIECDEDIYQLDYNERTLLSEIWSILLGQ